MWTPKKRVLKYWRADKEEITLKTLLPHACQCGLRGDNSKTNFTAQLFVRELAAVYVG